MTDKKEIKKYCSGIDCLTCNEAEPYIYRIANKLQEQLERKEEELQAQRNFTAQEQRKIYCVAYDKTCETGNECKQKKCVFKDKLKYKQALDKLIPILEYYATSTIGRKQVDGTYKCVCSTNKFGNECLNYDPRLAIEGLNIINKTKEGK